jgi:hypothetical protein
MNNNNIKSDIEQKFDRFRSVVYTIVGTNNDNNDYINSLRTSTVSEFLAQGQLLIKQYQILSSKDFANCVLEYVGMKELFDTAAKEQQGAILQYTAYFYEIIMLLNKQITK